MGERYAMAKTTGTYSTANAREPERPLHCPKCGSERTHVVGPSTLSECVSYYRCEACEYVISLPLGRKPKKSTPAEPLSHGRRQT